MIPDFEQQLNGKMEQASLNELMPDFDKEHEWQQLSGKLHPFKTRKLLPLWSYAAAVLLLFVCGLWYLKTGSGTNTLKQSAGIDNISAAPSPAANENNPITTIDTNGTPGMVIVGNMPPAKFGGGRSLKKGSDHDLVINYMAKDYICNNTPCPLQICISQVVQCPNVQPKDVSTCSTLEPDQSGQLHYRAHDSIAKNCSLTVKEIEITSIATGETILLNETSSPSTAQDVFSYITGKKKGDVLAGMFTSDCNHQRKKRGVRLNNKYGDLVIQ